MSSVQGRVVVVTGAFGALGSAVARKLRASGVTVALLGRAPASAAAAGMGAYLASKGGVERLTECLAAELAGHDVTVNSILPGIIDTPRNRADMPAADTKLWVQPDAIADVVLFLVSDQARAVNGASIRVV